MTVAEIVSAAWAAASGLGLALLASFILAGGGTRSRGALPFGLFALAWAIGILAVNLAPQLPGYAWILYLVFMGTALLVPYLLIEFAASYAPGGPRASPWKVLRWLTGGLAVVGASFLALRPGWFLQGTGSSAGLVYPEWTLLKVLLGDVTFVLASGTALAVLYVAMRKAPTSRTRNHLAVLLVGLGLYIAYASGNHLVGPLLYLFSGTPITLPGPQATIYFAAFLASSLLVLGLGIHSFHRFSKTQLAEDRKREMLMGSVLLFPLGWGILEGFLLSTFQSIGLWRLAGVAVIAYGLARWRIYDLPDRLRRAAASSTGFAGSLAGGALAFTLTMGFAGSLTLGLAGGFAVTGATASPSMRLARRWLAPSMGPQGQAGENRRFAQKIEAYRSAVEVSLARGTWEEDQTFLRGLQERYGIGPSEAQIIEHYARDAVVPVQEGEPVETYERIRLLGQGGAGKTWLARDRAHDRLVVLKEPLERWHNSPDVLQAAKREAELAAKVRHPNVVEVEKVIEDDGVPVLVIEHVPGGSLADLLEDEGPLEWPRAFELTEDVARGLEAVHQAGIVHRDIKPGNVLLTEDDVAKITDFGIAQRSESSGDTLIMDQQEPTGTEDFMAPEVKQKKTTGDEASDVYSCAALLHTLLTGAPPTKWTQLPSRVPEKVTSILERGLHPDPGERFETAQAFADALQEARAA